MTGVQKSLQVKLWNKAGQSSLDVLKTNTIEKLVKWSVSYDWLPAFEIMKGLKTLRQMLACLTAFNFH